MVKSPSLFAKYNRIHGVLPSNRHNCSRNVGYFDFVFITTVLSHSDFSPIGKVGLISAGKASCDRVMLPNIQCMLDILMFS